LPRQQRANGDDAHIQHWREHQHRARCAQQRQQAKSAAAHDQAYYYYCDHLGTPLELFDEQGKVVWSAQYKAWGRVRGLRVSDIEQPLRFQGQYEDRETGLYYNRARYYDPDSGRFITRDPIRLLGGENFYRYAPNPISSIDPLGLSYISHSSTNGGKGFDIYAICKDGGHVGYVGQTNDMDTRTTGHRQGGRLNKGENLRRITNVDTYGQARGYEEALMEKHKTRNGKWNKASDKSNLGNKKVGFCKNSKSRGKDRQKSFMDGYADAKEWIKNNLSSINPC